MNSGAALKPSLAGAANLHSTSNLESTTKYDSASYKQHNDTNLLIQDES